MTKQLSTKTGLVEGNPGGKFGWLLRRWFPVTATQAYLTYARSMHRKAAHRLIADFMNQGEKPWFHHLEIETLNLCNGSCEFCPVNRHNDPRPREKMPETLFSHIIDELADMGFAGYLCLFSNNEPLLDKRISDFAQEARRALPAACLSLSTNGLLLDTDSFLRLLPYFDKFVINNYRDQPKLHPNIEEIRAFCLNPAHAAFLRNKCVEINLRNPSDVLSSRAGASPNRQPPARPLADPCILPFTQMVVRPSGQVSLCCNDALGKATLGDLREQSLREIWFGQPYAALRQGLAEQGRTSHPLCRQCDFVKQTIH